MCCFPCSFTCDRQERSLRNEKAIQLGGVEMVPSIQSGARLRLSFYPSLILKTHFSEAPVSSCDNHSVTGYFVSLLALLC